jgi:hypothetical protein
MIPRHLSTSTALGTTLAGFAPIGLRSAPLPPRRQFCPWCKGDPVRSQRENAGHGASIDRFFCAQHHSWLEGERA